MPADCIEKKSRDYIEYPVIRRLHSIKFAAHAVLQPNKPFQTLTRPISYTQRR